MNDRVVTTGTLRRRLIRFMMIAAFTALSAPLLAILAMIIWWCASVQILAPMNEHTIAAMHAALPPRTPRLDAYAWLRAHRLRATNFAFAHWVAVGADNREWRRIDDGAWPLAGQQVPSGDGVPQFHVVENRNNPEVSVALNAGWTGACGGEISEKITFDHHDRVAQIIDHKPFWTCL